MSIRDIRKAARRELHQFMARPASYYSNPRQAGAVPEAVTVRVHSNETKAGDLAGTNLSYAERQDRRETVVFWVDQIPSPVRNALVILDSTEGYFVDNALPPDGQTITAEVVRCDIADMVGLLDPEGNVIVPSS
jgi:hypothetical protein